MEPVMCTVFADNSAKSEITFEVCILEQTEIPFETCLIVATDKFAPVNGYSTVDSSKSICLFTHKNKVYHNNIPKNEFVPLLVPLSDCYMFQIELAVDTEFKFGVAGSIYSCVVRKADNPKLFILNNITNDHHLFNQFTTLHGKIPHRIPQRPLIQRSKSLSYFDARQPAHIIKSPSRESIFDAHCEAINPPWSAQPAPSSVEYDVDRIFIRSFDPTSRNVVWRLRDINAGRLLLKFNQNITTYSAEPYLMNVVVIICNRDGHYRTIPYLTPEAIKLGITLDTKDLASVRILHAGSDLEPKSVALLH
ncbi:hypothetical protein PRJ_Dakar_00357 [Faustovirus]|nr:hypothetical protein PRJ_Dakar_00357 [Faustovirus]